MQSVVIAIPVYKTSLTSEERASFVQAVTVLGRYPIRLFTYSGLDLSAYHEIASGCDIEVVYFDRKYFGGTGKYNKLLISREFYQEFLDFEYMLIYQLDAWVFRDTLTEWCEKKFDYIGAPWYSGFTEAGMDSPFAGIGNGGLSLRKIRGFTKALSRFSYARNPFALMRKRIDENGLTMRNAMRILADFTVRNNTFHLFNNYDHNEDSFWGEVVARNFSWFVVPDELTAAQFSMEVNAPALYDRLGGQLPFGCHGWMKYHRSFWKKFISVTRDGSEK